MAKKLLILRPGFALYGDFLSFLHVKQVVLDCLRTNIYLINKDSLNLPTHKKLGTQADQGGHHLVS